MTGRDTFELAAAIAGVCIGLGGISLFTLVAVFGAWRVFGKATEAASNASRATIAIEELARHLSVQTLSQHRADAGQIAGLRQEAEALLEQERKLQQMTQELVEGGGLEGPSSDALRDLEATVSRLDATVGQMAASLANLVHLLEQRR